MYIFTANKHMSHINGCDLILIQLLHFAKPGCYHKQTGVSVRYPLIYQDIRDILVYRSRPITDEDRREQRRLSGQQREVNFFN
jgi:hypothetical protein